MTQTTGQVPSEDSGNEPVAYKPPKQRALEWAEDIRSRPLTDEQAIALAQVYASLAAVEAQERTTTALEALSAPLERFPGYMGLSGTVQVPEKPVSPKTPKSTRQTKEQA